MAHCYVCHLWEDNCTCWTLTDARRKLIRAEFLAARASHGISMPVLEALLFGNEGAPAPANTNTDPQGTGDKL